MNAIYQERHYKDVARILYGWTGTRTEVGHNPADCAECQSVALICEDFANLFAADNPPTCIVSILSAPIAHERHDCVLEGGFARERFLAACGLESEG